MPVYHRVSEFTLEMTDRGNDGQEFTDFCAVIQDLDHDIRFVGLADYGGKLVASFYRQGLVPLLDKKETEEYALQTVFRARTRGGFKKQIGNQRYAVTVYERLIRATISITHTEQEYHNM
jgi:hypothetical protein